MGEIYKADNIVTEAVGWEIVQANQMQGVWDAKTQVKSVQVSDKSSRLELDRVRYCKARSSRIILCFDLPVKGISECSRLVLR